MKAKKALLTAAEKMLHRWCIDCGYTVKEILSKKPDLHLERRKIARLMYKEGFTQEVIAQVMGRSRKRVNEYITGSKT